MEYNYTMTDYLSEWKKQIRETAIDECIEIVKFYRNSYDGIEWAIRDMRELKSKL